MRIGCQIGMWKGDATSEEKVAAVGSTGVSGIELFVEHARPYADEPGKLSDLLGAAGLTLTGAYFNSKRFLDVAAADELVAAARADARTLRGAGAGFLLLNGGLWRGDEPREFTDEEFAHLARLLNRIGDAAAGEGVRAVLHPHWKCQVETPADVDRLVAAGLDWQKVGLCVHAAHQYLAGADPYAIHETYAAAVRYVHVGDSDGDRKSCLLGEGALDQERLMRPLLAAGFDGWVIVECGQEGVTPEAYAAHAMAYLRATWPEANWQA
jgi:inosose dehydratase